MNPSPSSEARRENELVWQFFANKREGFFVEVGANEPQCGSQTWFFEERGWRGILVEPQSRICERLLAARPNSVVYQVACAAPGHPREMPFFVAEIGAHSSLVRNLVNSDTCYVETELVKMLTLDELLAEAGNPKIDLLSIDVEGTELEVLRGFDLARHRPGLLLLEDHLHTLTVHRYVSRQGYRLVKRTGLNNWYVARDRPFSMTSPLERLRLWKKVWANTPFRKLRVYLNRKRSTRRRAQSQ